MQGYESPLQTHRKRLLSSYISPTFALNNYHFYHTWLIAFPMENPRAIEINVHDNLSLGWLFDWTWNPSWPNRAVFEFCSNNWLLHPSAYSVWSKDFLVHSDSLKVTIKEVKRNVISSEFWFLVHMFNDRVAGLSLLFWWNGLVLIEISTQAFDMLPFDR